MINNKQELILYNIEAEQNVLGLLIKNINNYDEISDIITADCFYELAHKNIFEKIKELVVNNKFVNDSILYNFFENDDILKSISGSNYLNILLNSSIGILDIRSYVLYLIELASKRKLFEIQKLIFDNLQNDRESNDIIVSIRNIIDDIEDENQQFSYNLKNSFDLVKDKILEITNSVDNNYENNNFIKTNFCDFDNNFGGLPRSSLIILAGRPSMGKTTLALQFALNVAKQNKKVLFFSQEMSNNENSDKIISNLNKINSTRIRDKKLNNQAIKSILEKQEYDVLNNFFIDDKAKIDSEYIKKTIKHFKRKYGNIDLIIVDHLQITGDSRKSKNKIELLGNITEDFKNIAKQEQCAFLLLSQLSRAVELRDNRRPELSDLRDSGEIEQNADLVIFIYRHEYYISKLLQGINPENKQYNKLIKELNESKNICELLIKKYRNGRNGFIKLYFYPETSEFNNLRSLFNSETNNNN